MYENSMVKELRTKIEEILVKSTKLKKGLVRCGIVDNYKKNKQYIIYLPTEFKIDTVLRRVGLLETLFLDVDLRMYGYDEYDIEKLTIEEEKELSLKILDERLSYSKIILKVLAIDSLLLWNTFKQSKELNTNVTVVCKEMVGFEYEIKDLDNIVLMTGIEIRIDVKEELNKKDIEEIIAYVSDIYSDENRKKAYADFDFDLQDMLLHELDGNL